MSALLPMDEIERWRAEARAISHEDNLGHLVVYLLELMQSVLVGGLQSETLHLKIRAVSVECEKIIANDQNRAERERRFLYGVTQSLCALLNTLAGGGEEGAEKASLQIALVPHVEKRQEEHAEQAVEISDSDSLVHDTTQIEEPQEEGVDVTSTLGKLEDFSPEQFQLKYAEIMNRKADDSGVGGDDSLLDETRESEDQQSANLSTILADSENSSSDGNALLAMAVFKGADNDSGTILPRKRARSSYFKKIEEAEEKRRRDEQDAINERNVIEKMENFLGETANPLQCRVCGVISRCVAEVKTHMRIHTGERPYACTECGSSYKESFHLKSHLRKSHGLNPYSCHCGEQFATRSEMVAHRDNEHKAEKGVFKCDKCPRSYMFNHGLNLHLREKHGVMPYPCECCGEGFPFRNDLVYHRMKVHGK
ncbi:hypothetical protein PRIPAC_81185 [Pristionchus pacificus]|uniref:Zinc finger protein n=1 Tax=Pristionchus pacificus TaxID=54126 RepID=A0A2A6BI91_PRIPA|nr:hypothetical protein PRIPAC_81185 [Pristionchus pacificus]|eukprot:PDM65583.1 zinc finger protein [Pristionchus pacificus]